jgi:hypothetical protein
MRVTDGPKYDCISTTHNAMHTTLKQPGVKNRATATGAGKLHNMQQRMLDEYCEPN